MPPHELYRILFILFTVACMMICVPKEQWESNRVAVGADKCSDNTTIVRTSSEASRSVDGLTA